MPSSKHTKLVGILNLTPDSFSDGGKYNDKESILSQTQKLITNGSAIIDVGAESTRPGATALSHEQEWQRLENTLPDIIKLCHKHNVLVSLDTYHPESAKNAIDLGVDWINDVDGFKNANMIDVVKKSDVKFVMMHSLTVPADKNTIINKNHDPLEEVKQWAQQKIVELTDKGIQKDRIIFDPGIGFNKDAQQSWELLNRISEFKDLGVELYVGHSRKSFLGDVANRDAETIKVSEKLIASGVNYIRVHDVAGHATLLYRKLTS